MNAEIAANPVPCSVIIVEALCPKGATRKRIKLGSGRALRKACHRQCYVTLQHAGETVAHFRRWLAERYRARDIRRPVEILRARIEEIESARLQLLLSFGCRTIVN